MLPGLDPAAIQRMMAMMALRNPEQLAQRAAMMGLRPPALPPAATPAATPPGAPTGGMTETPAPAPGGVSMQDYIARGFDPAEFVGDHLMPDPSMQYRGPMGAAGLPSHTAAMGPAGAPVAVQPPVTAPQPAPGMDIASAISAMGALAQPSAAAAGAMPQAPSPRVGGGMNPQLLQIMQALVGNRGAAAPSLGALIGG